MYLDLFLVDFAVFRGFFGISRDFAEIPEFRGSATTRNIRSPAYVIVVCNTARINIAQRKNRLMYCLLKKKNYIFYSDFVPRLYLL